MSSTDPVVNTAQSSSTPPLSMTESAAEKYREDIEGLKLKIATWSQIAFKHGIDITEETTHLDWLKNDVKVAKPSCPEAITMLRVYKAKSLLASRIVKKVTKNFHREVEGEKVEKLKQELFDFTQQICVPWVRRAKAENVDIQEEYTVMYSAIMSEMDLLTKASAFQKEVIFRRQLVTRQIATSRIVQKVFRERIDKLANELKAKDWYNDERQQIIEGIRLEAQQALPSSSNPSEIIDVCQTIFDLYKANVELFDQNPELYHALADREVFTRSVDERAKGLLNQLDCSSPRRTQIEQIRVTAHQLLEREGYSDDLMERVNRAFDAFDETRAPSISAGCGFGGITKP